MSLTSSLTVASSTTGALIIFRRAFISEVPSFSIVDILGALCSSYEVNSKRVWLLKMFVGFDLAACGGEIFVWRGTGGASIVLGELVR